MKRLTAAIRVALPAIVLLLCACAAEKAHDDLTGGARTVDFEVSDRTGVTDLSPFVKRSVWEFNGTPGLMLSSRNYRLYTTGTPAWMQEYAIDFAEQAMLQYRSALADLPEPARPLEIYLFSDRGEWRAYTRSLMKENADLYLNLGRGGYATRGMAVLYDIGFDDTFAILSHEGWHQYTQVTFKHPLPTWLEEGLATFMEGRLQVPGQRVEFRPRSNPQRLQALRIGRDHGDLITLSELVDRSPQYFLEKSNRQLLTYYAQVWAMAQFLVWGEQGRYREGLARLLADAVEGRIVSTILSSVDVPPAKRRRMAVSQFGPGVILAYFNSDFSEFAEQYDAYLAQLVESDRPRGSIAD